MRSFELIAVSFLLIKSISMCAAQTLQRQPQLECLNDGLRLHFFPDAPFYGHVYIKGFFADRSCHLDFTMHPLYEPFFFHIPYNSQCNIRREKMANPPGIRYHVIVIVQHHHLFVTAADKAYSVSCFYRERPNQLTQTIEVGNLPTTEIVQGEQLPTCIYEVLNGSLSGAPVKFANVGDKLVHRWHCDTEKHGMLVHSCVVCDPAGNQFELIDERGCVRDETLMEPLKYSPDLTTATSIAPAFKFADQMIVHFACRVTLCTREQLGCEGITPPVCQFLPLPPNIPYSDVSPTSATNAYFQSTTTKMPLLPLPNSERILQPSSTLTATIATPSTKSSRRAAATTTGAFGMRTSKTTSQYPSNAYGVPISSDSNTNYFFDYDAGTVREKQPNWPRHARRAPNNETRSADDSMTFDVSAAQMIVFSRDETERQPTVVDAFGECRIVQMPAIVFAIALFALFMLSTALLCLQKRFYEKRLLKCSFSPNFEMLRVKNF